MKPDIHPSYSEITVSCSCGHSFTTRASISSETLKLDVCDNCHPFYTGKDKVLDSAGRIQQFQNRYENLRNQKN